MLTDARPRRTEPLQGQPPERNRTCLRTSGPRIREPRSRPEAEGLDEDADAADEDALHVHRSKENNKTAPAQRALAGSDSDQPTAAARLATAPNGI